MAVAFSSVCVTPCFRKDQITPGLHSPHALMNFDQLSSVSFLIVTQVTF